MKHRIKNPLIGKIHFTENGMEIKDGITFGGEMQSKVSPREWFYLMFDAHNGPLPEYVDGQRRSLLGSRVTIWRLKKSLIKKGYIIKNSNGKS